MGLLAEVSYRCPLHCPYCSNPTHVASGAELTTETWQRVLGEAGEMGVLHALFSGGEPLVRSDLEDLIVVARESGLYTNLITSAIGFTSERARSLKQAGLDCVQISFQSDQTDLADSITGASTHSRKLEAATIAHDLGFPLTINVVLHRFNIDRAEAVIALAEDLVRGRLELARPPVLRLGDAELRGGLPDRSQVAAAAPRRRLHNRV